MDHQDNIIDDPSFKPDLDEDRSVFSCTVDYSEVIQFGERYTNSSYVIAQYIKLILKANGITDPSRIPSLSGVQRMRQNVGKKTLENHEKKTKGLQCLKFDGKTTWEAIGQNQLDKAHFVTVVAEPEIDFVDFYKVSNESGRALAEGLWSEVIVPTESQETLLALGSGKY